MRIVSIDGFRGLCLLLVAYTHTQYQIVSMIGNVNYNSILWVEPAAGFVGISGFLLGLVSAKLLIGKGQAAADAFFYKRLRVLVTWHLASVVVVLLIAQFIAAPSTDMGNIGRYPFVGSILVATFLVPAKFFDVLTMYFFLIAFSPLAIRICQRSSPLTVIGLSVGLWLVGQTGIGAPASNAIAKFVAVVHGGDDWERHVFRLINWQIMYFVPFVLAYVIAQKPDVLSVFKTDAARHVSYVAAAVFAVLLVVKGVQVNFPEQSTVAYLQDVMAANFDKPSVGGGYLLGAAMFGFMFTYLLSEGVSDRHAAIRIVARGLHRFLTLPMLVRVGQASIYVFSTNTMFVYLMTAIEADRFGEWAKTACIFASLALAIGISWLVPQVRRMWSAAAVRKVETPA